MYHMNETKRAEDLDEKGKMATFAIVYSKVGFNYLRACITIQKEVFHFDKTMGKRSYSGSVRQKSGHQRPVCGSHYGGARRAGGRGR